MCRLINDPASDTAHLTPDPASSPGSRKTQNNPWTSLQYQFDLWYSLLPLSFQAGGVLSHQSSQDAYSSMFAEEAWFSSNACAVAIAHYHMARILLLILQPSSLSLMSGAGEGPHFDLLHAYRSVQEQMRRHAKQIISISLGMPEDITLVYMIQPLYVSGRFLTDSSDRRRLVGILKSIDQTLGCSTEYRIRDLYDEWGVNPANRME